MLLKKAKRQFICDYILIKNIYICTLAVLNENLNDDEMHDFLKLKKFTESSLEIYKKIIFKFGLFNLSFILLEKDFCLPSFFELGNFVKSQKDFVKESISFINNMLIKLYKTLKKLHLNVFEMAYLNLKEPFLLLK